MKRHSSDVKRHRAVVTVGIVLPHNAWTGAIGIVRDLLNVVGTLSARSTDVGASRLFDVGLIGTSRAPVPGFGGVSLRPDVTTHHRGQLDVVIVPPQFAATADTTAEDAILIDWLRSQYQGGAIILAVGGTLLLAKSGLLDGQRATGLVNERPFFAVRFPLVRFNPSRRVIASDRIITIGGIGPVPEGCAHLVEHFFGVQLARRFLRYASTETLPAEEHLALWCSHLKRHGDSAVLAIQEIIENDLQSIPSATELGRKTGLSTRTLTRRFVIATGMNLRQYAAELRVELADFLLRSTRLSLTRIADQCGYGSPSAMSRAFSDARGISPLGYRRRAK